MEDIETVGFRQFPKGEEGPEAKGFNLRENTETGGSKFVEMEGRKYFEGLAGRKKIPPLAEKITVLHPMNGRPP
jgi:hypothetical protein